MAIYTDSGNVPNTLVTNSASDEIVLNSTSFQWWSHTYGTKPQITGGQKYWIGVWAHSGAGNFEISLRANSSGGVSYKITETYHSSDDPTITWGGTSDNDDVCFAAEYQAAAGGIVVLRRRRM